MVDRWSCRAKTGGKVNYSYGVGRTSAAMRARQ